MTQSADPEISTFDALLSAVGVTDANSLMDIMENITDETAWIHLNGSGEETLTICVANRGTELEYPFPLSEFWETLDDLNAEINFRGALSGLEEEIRLVERFEVELMFYSPQLWIETPYPTEYPYKRAASGGMTVAAWLEKRFQRHYPDYEITVTRPGRSTARGQLRLRTLRELWLSNEDKKQS